MRFFELVKRLGLRRTCLGYGIAILRRVLTLQLAEVSARMEPSHAEQIPGYANRMVNQEAFEALHESRRHRDFAFARGDHCVVSVCEKTGESAGFIFYSAAPTLVNEFVEFTFPADQFTYSFAAFTPQAHRGKRIAPSRWGYYTQWRERTGRAPRVIRYIDVDNFSSILSGGEKPKFIKGYTGYLRLGKFVWCWSSPVCKAHNVGFRKRRPVETRGGDKGSAA